MLRVIPAVLLLASCGPPDGDKTASNPDSETATWDRGLPIIDSRDLVPGHPWSMSVDGVPVSAPVRFYRSYAGTGAGECFDRHETVCLGLVDAELVHEAVGSAQGGAEWRVDVDLGEPPRVVWFQVVVTDPTSGAVALTSVLQRHVAVPPHDSPVHMRLTNAVAGVGVPTGGNSHTGGVAWVDANADFLPDLFVTNSTNRGHRLFLNRGDGTFADWSARVPKPDPAIEDAGVAFADIDNDGDEDILVVADSPRPMSVSIPQERDGGPNMLYVNGGDGTFTEAAAGWGVVDPRGWRTSCGNFGDYDRDGLVDLYLCSWAVLSDPLGQQDKDDRLLRNTGTTFAPATQAVDGHGRDALVARMADFDQDGWPDLYVGNVAEHDDPPIYDPKDVLYMSREGVFEDRTDDGLGQGMDAWAAMGTTLGDIDNDGRWELYVTDHWDYPPEPRGNPLYRMRADGTFSDNVCVEAGICAGYLSWPANFADLDLDGWVDLWVGTAWSAHNDLVYLNRGDGTFDLHAQPAMAGNATHGGAVADYDLDGDVDIYLYNDAGSSSLFTNDLRVDRRWLQLRLRGTTSNRSAIGAVIRVTADGRTQMRMVSGGDSAHSQSDRTQVFGLGAEASARVEITWPSGLVEDLGALASDTFYVVDEGAGVLSESLAWTEVVHDATAGALTVRVRSSYGGRTGLRAEGVDLVYDAEQGLHAAVLPWGPAPPASVTVESVRGGTWPVALEVP